MSDEIRIGTMEIVDNKEKMNFNGLQLNIQDIIGDKLVTQYMAQLKDEDLQAVYDKINEMLFEKYTDNGVEYKKLNVYKRDKNGNYIRKSGWGGNYDYEETPLWQFIQKQYEETFKEKIKEEINRRFESEEFLKKVNDAADKIIEYAVEGYKEDMIKRIRERLVGNVFDACPSYAGIPLTDLINRLIDERIRIN